MRRCPGCGELLARRRFDGIEVDGCGSCGGIWLDAGELASLSAAGPETLGAIERTFVAGIRPALAPAPTNACPRCAKALVAAEYKNLRGLRLASCRECKGVFLEQGQVHEAGVRLGVVSDGSQAANHAVAAGDVAAGDAAAGAAAAGDVAVAPIAAAAGGAPRRAAFLEHPGAVAAAAAGASSAELRPATASRPALAAVHDETSTKDLPIVRGSVLPAYEPSGGLMDRLHRGLAFLRAAWVLGLECKLLLVPVLGGAFLNVALAGVALAVLVAAGVFSRGTAHEGAADVLAWGLLAAWGLSSRIIDYGSMGTTVSMIDAYLKGRTPKIGTGLKDVAKNFGGIVALAVVDTIVSAITSSLRRRRGLAGMLAGAVGSAIQAVWTVLSFLLLPVIMIEDVGLGTALRRVREIHQRNLVQIGLGEIGVRAVAGGLAFVVVMAVLGLGAVLVPLGTPGIVVTVLVGSVAILAVWTLNTFVRAAYYTSLYLWAAEVERAGAGQPAMVPAPLAAAFA